MVRRSSECSTGSTGSSNHWPPAARSSGSRARCGVEVEAGVAVYENRDVGSDGSRGWSERALVRLRRSEGGLWSRMGARHSSKGAHLMVVNPLLTAS